MTAEELQEEVWEELKAARKRGLGRLGKETPTPRLDVAAKGIPTYRSNVRRAVAIMSLLEYEIVHLSISKYETWLPVLLGLTEGTDNTDPTACRAKAAELAGDSVTNFSRPDIGQEALGLKALAEQIVADCFPSDNSQPDTHATSIQAQPVTDSTALYTPTTPSPPHFTPADLATLARLVAMPQPGHIRTHKGFLGSLGIPTLRRQAAITAHILAEIDQTIGSNPALAELTKNNEAHAVVAFSGGTPAGARRAGRDILYDLDSYDAPRALAAAFVHVGGKHGRRNAAAALKLLAQNQSQAVDPGRLDIVTRGILRLTGRNLMLAKALFAMYQETSRANGRIDLGGQWNDPDKVGDADAAGAGAARYIYKAGGTRQAQQLARYDAYAQTIADLTVLDGIERTEVKALVRGHPHQMRQLIGDDSTDEHGVRLCQGTLERMLESARDEHRIEAAVIVLEMHSVLAQANESSKELIQQFFDRRNLDPKVPDFAEQLAKHTGVEGLMGAQLREKTRNRG